MASQVMYMYQSNLASVLATSHIECAVGSALRLEAMTLIHCGVANVKMPCSDAIINLLE